MGVREGDSTARLPRGTTDQALSEAILFYKHLGDAYKIDEKVGAEYGGEDVCLACNWTKFDSWHASGSPAHCQELGAEPGVSL